MIPFDYAQQLINEASRRAAEEASAKTLANLVPQNPNPEVGVMDRRGVVVSQQEYERLRRDTGKYTGDGNQSQGIISLGRRFEEAFNNKFTDELIGKSVSGIFGGGNLAPAKPKGILGGILGDVLDTKFGLGLGEALGNNVSALVKQLGEKRIGALIDGYTGQQNQNGQGNQTEQEQLTPEEQQKRGEAVIMSLDSTNTAHVTNFMQTFNIKDYTEAQKAILTEQDRILQSRGLARQIQPQQEQQVQKSIQSTQHKQSNQNQERQQNKDINRQLIDQYEQGDIDVRDRNQTPQFFESSPQSNNSNIDPFNTAPTYPGESTINNPSGNINIDISENDFIMSLDPHDPTSQQQYMARKKISGVPLEIVIKMMLKDKKALMSGKVEQQKPEIIDIPSEKIEKVTSQELQQVFQQPQEIPSEITNLMNVLQKVSEKIDISMKEMKDKITFLEDEIINLKSNKENVESKVMEDFHKEVNEIYSDKEIEEINIIPEQSKETYNINNEIIDSNRKDIIDNRTVENEIKIEEVKDESIKINNEGTNTNIPNELEIKWQTEKDIKPKRKVILRRSNKPIIEVENNVQEINQTEQKLEDENILNENI